MYRIRSIMPNAPRYSIVENNEKESRLLKHILEGESYGVVTVSSGWAAIEMIKRSNYDLALIDYGLTDMKGDELAIELKKELPNIKLILLTGFLPAINIIKLEKFDYVLEKQVNPQKIIETIRQNFSQKSD